MRPAIRSGKTWVLPAAILLLALLLRLPGLDRWPPALHQDEASNGVDAWSLLTTGADRAGRVWPVFLEGFGDGDNRTSLYALLAVPGTAVAGPGTVATRLPAALLGVWTVMATFLFVRKIRGTGAAAAAALLLAISPWHIYLSRFGHEASITPAFLVTALWLVASGRWAIAGLVLGAGLYTYPSARLFIPAMIAVCAVAGFGPEPKRAALRLPIALVAASIPLIVATLAHPDRFLARARAASLFGNVEPFGFAVGLFLKQYIAHFGPRFLLLQGDGNFMHTPAGMGELAWPLAIALPLGLYFVVKRRDRWDRLLLAWFLLYPIASATTLGDRPEYVPHALRAAVGLPVFEILGACGIVSILERIRGHSRRWGAVGILAAVGLVNLCLFAAAFTGDYARRVAPLYHSAYVRAIRDVAARQSGSEQILISAGPDPQAYVHAILYGLQTPREYQTAEKVITQTETFHLVHRSGRIFYVLGPEDVAPVRSALAGRVYAIVGPDEMHAGRVLATFTYDDGSPGLEVRELDLPTAESQRK
jgi:4-amino-4-deoxy-L-arabinose transferase-like glycosyltransferase